MRIPNFTELKFNMKILEMSVHVEYFKKSTFQIWKQLKEPCSQNYASKLDMWKTQSREKSKKPTFILSRGQISLQIHEIHIIMYQNT